MEGFDSPHGTFPIWAFGLHYLGLRPSLSGDNVTLEKFADYLVVWGFLVPFSILAVAATVWCVRELFKQEKKCSKQSTGSR